MKEMDSYMVASAAAAVASSAARSAQDEAKGCSRRGESRSKRSGGVGGSGGVYTKFTAMIEYVLLAGVNDQPEQAHQLGPYFPPQPSASE
jgi:hypothetical protein